MNKWIAISLITILALGVIATGYLYWQQTTKLGEAESEIDALEDSVASLESDVATLETQLADSEATVSTLQIDLAAAESLIVTLRSDYETAQSVINKLEYDLSSAQLKYTVQEEKVSRAKSYLKILDEWYFMPDWEGTSSQLALLQSNVEDTGDADLLGQCLFYIDNYTTYEVFKPFLGAVLDKVWGALR